MAGGLEDLPDLEREIAVGEIDIEIEAEPPGQLTGLVGLALLIWILSVGEEKGGRR